MRISNRWLVLALVFTAAGMLLATTWGPIEMECPVCHTKNTFNTWGSYGSYIYEWPSKFQNIYWPATDGNSLYTCKHCYLTLFMQDFTNLPASKIEDVRHVLQNVTIDEKHQAYTDISMSKRLEIAEKIYSVLDKDDNFWSWFYRVQGYHSAREKHPAQADAARAKALDCTRKLLNDPANAGKRKELLFTSGAMHHFLGDDASAKHNFGDALKTSFEDTKLTKEENANVNHNLDQLLKEYVDRLEKKSVPKDDGTDTP